MPWLQDWKDVRPELLPAGVRPLLLIQAVLLGTRVFRVLGVGWKMLSWSTKQGRVKLKKTPPSAQRCWCSLWQHWKSQRRTEVRCSLVFLHVCWTFCSGGWWKRPVWVWGCRRACSVLLPGERPRPHADGRGPSRRQSCSAGFFVGIAITSLPLLP